MPSTKHPICTIEALRPVIGLITLLLLFAIFLLFPLNASAHAYIAASGGPSMNISAGFNARYRDGNWIPVQVTLSNNGPDFTGNVVIPVPAPYTGGNAPATIYKTPISLATGAQKQITIYIPLSLGASGSTQSLAVNLLDNNGQTVNSQTTTVRALGIADIFVGLLSDQTAGFGPLNAASLPNQTASLIVEPLTATTFPTTTNVLKNFDLLILDNFTTSTLSPIQLATLQEWVNQGGTLLIVGGPEWRHTLTGLPAALLPITVSGTKTLTTPTSVLPIGSPGNGGVNEQNVDSTVTGPLIVSTASPTASSTTLLSTGNIPLFVQGQYGQGSLYYMAFDPTLNPIANWPHASLLWQGLLIRSLGDQLLTQNPVRGTPAGMFASSAPYDMSGLLQSFLPNTFPSISLILGILFTYILVLGPMRYFIVRRLKKRDWSWRIVLVTIILFSVLSYAIALQQKGTTIVSDTISVLQLGQMQNNQTLAHEMTYVGVFVPSNGDFHVDVGNNYLVQPSNSQFGASTASQNTTITANHNGIDTELQGVNIWTLHSVKAEQDRALHGGIVSHLTLQNGTLTGTITNTLSYALDDVYVLMASNYVSLGQVGAGQTQQVTIALNTNGSSISLAEQIAASNGISGPAFGGYNGQPPQTELARHISMLSTMGGNGPYNCGGGGFCYGPVHKIVTSNGVMITSNGGIPSINSQDPLLLPDAPATLIGWSDTPSAAISNVTINGNQPSGAQEVMLQAPLDVNLAGSVTLPTSFVDGHMVDVQNQSANIQVQLPGIYTMTTGSVTFEMTIPNYAKLHVTSATISEPSDINQALQASGASPGTVSDVSSAQVNVYNWQSGKWDTVSVSNGVITLSNPNAYIGPNGRILLQISNQDASKGTIAFSTPTLQVQGKAQ